jgi:hypothetical protein
MAKATKTAPGATKRSSTVRASLGSAARVGGGGKGVISKVANFLAGKGNRPTGNLVGKGGKLNLGPGRKGVAKSVGKATGIGAGSRKASGGGGRSH